MPRSSADRPRRKSRRISVFINCPFDEQYNSIFDAIVFSVHACGFFVRCAKEDAGSDTVRIDRLVSLIRQCELGIHDLSRIDTTGKLPRFNMPLELGIFVGAQKFGQNMRRRKKWLGLEGEKFKYKEFLSDVSGQDLAAHEDDPAKAVLAVRRWLSDQAFNRVVPGRDRILLLYEQFKMVLPGLLEEAGQDVESMTFKEFRRYVDAFLAVQTNE